MGGYLERMVGRSFGRIPTVQPLIRSHYAPGPDVAPAAAIDAWPETVETWSIDPAAAGPRTSSPLAGEQAARQAPAAGRVAEGRPPAPAVRLASPVQPPASPPPRERAQVFVSPAVEAEGPGPAVVEQSAQPSHRRAEAAQAAAPPPQRVAATDGMPTPVVSGRGDETPALPAISQVGRHAARRMRAGDTDLLEQRDGGEPIETPAIRPVAESRSGPRTPAPPESGARTLGSMPLESSSRPRQVVSPAESHKAGPLQQVAQGESRVPSTRELAQTRLDRRSAPIVRVTIGRVEVRAVTAAEPRAARPAAVQRGPELSLEDYLKQRNGS